MTFEIRRSQAILDTFFIKLAGNDTCLQDVLKKLPAEARKQISRVEGTDKKLRRVREMMKMNSSLSAKEMVERCIIPRLLISPEDAIYCAIFFLRMHELDMPGFSTCYAIDQVSRIQAIFWGGYASAGTCAGCKALISAGYLHLGR